MLFDRQLMFSSRSHFFLYEFLIFLFLKTFHEYIIREKREVVTTKHVEPEVKTKVALGFEELDSAQNERKRTLWIQQPVSSSPSSSRLEYHG